MIEVFKTNVLEKEHARRIVEEIQRRNAHYVANFDLDDRDHILRIRALSGEVCTDPIIELLEQFGFSASVLA